MLKLSAPEQFGIFFVDLDELHQGLDAEVGKRHDAFVSDAVDPDEPVLGVHLIGDVPQPVLVFPEVLGEAGNVVT